MYVKTFLVGLLLAMKAARAYIERNQDGVKDHSTAPGWLRILNALEAITAVISDLLGNPIVALGARVKRTSPEYQATLNNLRQESVDDYIRIPARVMRREEYEEWRKTL